MAIEVGKDVVAIINHSEGEFKKGEIFTCVGLRQSKCKCSFPEINIGKKSFAGYQTCDKCETRNFDSSIYTWYCTTSFRALDDITPSIEEIIKENTLLELTT